MKKRGVSNLSIFKCKSFVLEIILVSSLVLFMLYTDTVPKDTMGWMFLGIIVVFFLIASVMLFIKINGVLKEYYYFFGEYNKAEDCGLDSYEKISKIFSNNSDKFTILNRLFDEYNKTILVENNVRYATTEAEYIFSEENVLYKNMNFKTINYLPQILTGIGIFGTFLG